MSSRGVLDFHDGMRKLWEDHITWTRMVIVSVFAGLPDLDPTLTRLLRNQTDLGDAVKPFYGPAAGNRLALLLHDHITIAAEILFAAKAGNSAAFDDAHRRWHANANDIAAFLNGANPRNWPLEMMRAMMRDHLELTLEEAVTYLRGDYEGSIAAYERVHLQILGMADMLSSGIVAQVHQAGQEFLLA